MNTGLGRMDFFRKLFNRRSSLHSAAAPYWAEAFDAPSGPSAPLVKLKLPGTALSALDLGLRQRGLEPMGQPRGRWLSELRVAYVRELSGGDWLLVLAGHRVEELSDGLKHEAKVPLEPAGDAAAALEPADVEEPATLWHVGLPSSWRERVDAEERQRAEARKSAESKLSERRASGAATMARLELLDRGPWVERAVVFWEESSGRAELPLATLFLRELAWLQAAQDPVVDALLALLHLLGQENASVAPLMRDLPQPRSALGHSREHLLQQVPTEVAAAAAGVPPAQRRSYAGPGRYESALRAVQDSTTRAALRVEAAQVLLERYESGWNPPALLDASELLRDALYHYAGGSHPTSRAGALVLLARAQVALGDVEGARASLEEAASHVIDERGLPRDEALAQEILERLA